MIRFNSVLQPERFGYQLSSAADNDGLWRQYYNTPPRQFISVNLQQWETLGDTGVQHSPAYPARRENLCDCMVSLIEHTELCSKSGGFTCDDVSNSFTYLWLDTIRPSMIDMLAKIRYKEDKPQWWSWAEMKVTTRESARYDKRYFEVCKDWDGTKPIEQVAWGWHQNEPRVTRGLLDQTWVRYQAQRRLDSEDIGNPWYEELKREEWDAMHMFFEVMRGWKTMARGLNWKQSVISMWKHDHKEEAAA